MRQKISQNGFIWRLRRLRRKLQGHRRNAFAPRPSSVSPPPSLVVSSPSPRKQLSLPRSSPGNHRRLRHLSVGEILMGLQGPSRSNYVEQPASLTGPRLPGERTQIHQRSKTRLLLTKRSTRKRYKYRRPSFITAAAVSPAGD